jgi:hypothetical protein
MVSRDANAEREVFKGLTPPARLGVAANQKKNLDLRPSAAILFP